MILQQLSLGTRPLRESAAISRKPKGANLFARFFRFFDSLAEAQAKRD